MICLCRDICLIISNFLGIAELKILAKCSRYFMSIYKNIYLERSRKAIRSSIYARPFLPNMSSYSHIDELLLFPKGIPKRYFSWITLYRLCYAQSCDI